jgi:hypothetical protein
MAWDALTSWAKTTDLLLQLHHSQTSVADFDEWINQLVHELVASGAAARNPSTLRNVG